MNLPGKKKILIHLYQIGNHEDHFSNFPRCQEGIADHVKLSINRVSNLLKELENNNLLFKESKDVKGGIKKRYVYYLTDEGKKEAGSIIKDLHERKVLLKDEAETIDIKFKDIEKYIESLNPEMTALNQSTDGTLNLKNIGDNNFLINRKKEKNNILRSIEENKEPNMILLKGKVGSGKTTLLNEMKCLLEKKNYKVEKNFTKVKDLIQSSVSDNVTDNYPILLLDDLHDFEDDFLNKLIEITSKLENKNFSFLGTYDPEITTQESSEYIKKLSYLEIAEEFQIKNFSWIETRRWLMEKSGIEYIDQDFIDEFYEITGGRPHYASSLYNKLLENDVIDPIKGQFDLRLDKINTPKEIRSAVEKKLSKLSDKEIHLLKSLSCCSNPVKKEFIIEQILEEKDNAEVIIEELSERDLITKDEKSELKFSNNLEKKVIFSKINRDQRKKIRKELIGCMKNRCDDFPRLTEEMGYQYEKVGNVEEACKNYLKSAEVCSKRREHESAIKLYRKIIEILNKNDIEIEEKRIREKMADALRTKKKNEEALNNYQLALDKCQEELNLLSLHIKMTKCLRMMREYDRALDHINSAKEISTDIDEKDDEFKKKRCALQLEEGLIHLRKSNFDKCKDIFTKLRSLSKEANSAKFKSKALHYLGTLDYYRSEFYKAKDLLKKAIQIKKELDDREGLIKSYNNLGVIFRRMSRSEDAIEYFKKANQITKEMGNKKGDPDALDNLGITYFDMGLLEKSLTYHKKCLEIEKKNEDEHGIAATLDNIGVVHFQKGEFDEAIPYHEKSLKLKKRLDNKLGISFSFYNLGRSYLEKSEFKKAEEYLQKSLDIRADLGDKQNMGYSNLWLGIVYLNKGQVNEGETYLKNALELFKTSKDDYGMGMALSYLGKINMEKNQFGKSKGYFDHCKKIESKLKDKRYEIVSNRNLGDYYYKKEKLSKAKRYTKKALKEADKSGMKDELGKCKLLLGKILKSQHIVEKSEMELKDALGIFEENGNKLGKSKSLAALGDLLAKKGEKEKAKSNLNEAEKIREKIGVTNTNY